MMRKATSLTMAIILLSNVFTIWMPYPSVEANGYGDYPPPGIGDWIINVDTYVGNETILLNGNLFIELGATLTFRNVTLIMNSTSDGEFGIEVKNGSSFFIYDLDNDNATTDDASNITAYNPDFEYEFKVRKWANFSMQNSELHEAGYGPFLWVDNYGLFIETDNATVNHNLISNNYYGIVLYGSDAVISNNTIESNDHTGIRATTWSNGTIENNLIARSNTYGVWVDGWDNTMKRSSNPIIRNNLIFETGRGATTAVGIQITAYSNPTIIDNRIINYTEDAIYFGQWSQATVENLTIDADGGNYGLASSAPRNVTVTNCSINNTNWWDLSLATAYFTLTNATFNQSKVIFQGTDSNLTVNWFLNSYVNDSSGNPIPNANVRITDNANGTFDENYTTDSNGFLNWTVLTEYFQKDNNGDKDGDDLGEKILYTPHNLTISKPGYLTAYADVEMNQSKYITITLQVDEKPEINHTQVASANIGETINITANITDDVSVDAVYLDYTGVNATNYNVSMNKWNGNWSYEIPGQNNIGLVDYFIWCNDTSGNANMTGVNQTQINDITDPKINHTPVTLANVFDVINIIANITDDVAVDFVFLNYTGVNGTNYNVSMNNWNGNWSYEISGQNTTGFIGYFIWANDTSGNDNRTPIYQIQIYDVTDPLINHTPITSANIDDTINITANVTDDVGVASVYLNYTDIHGVTQNISMKKWNGNWSYNIPGQDSVGVLKYFIWANDTTGNENRTVEYSIQINDVTPPIVVAKSPTGENVSVSALISITFSEPMNETSVENAVSISPTISNSTFAWNSDSTILTIIPASNLSQNTTYNVTIDTGAKDIYENQMASEYSWSFTTWADIDDDGIPDSQDLDDDNDGFLDEWEEYLGTDPVDPNDAPIDTDGDGLPDGDTTNSQNWMDTDDDGDDVIDTDDAFPLDSTEYIDTDNDGIGNNADPDDDNDGVPDSEDLYPLDSTRYDDGNSNYWWMLLIIVIVLLALLLMYNIWQNKKREIEEEEEIEEPEPPIEKPE